jgi:hypothetical protein
VNFVYLFTIFVIDVEVVDRKMMGGVGENKSANQGDGLFLFGFEKEGGIKFEEECVVSEKLENVGFFCMNLLFGLEVRKRAI